MITRITVDNAGRVLIPKALRETLRLEAGDELDLDAEGEQITLRPVRDHAPLAREQGVWVFRTGKPLAATTAHDVLRSLRDERDRTNIEPPR